LTRKGVFALIRGFPNGWIVARTQGLEARSGVTVVGAVGASGMPAARCDSSANPIGQI
jgi:hypothetical protein